MIKQYNGNEKLSLNFRAGEFSCPCGKCGKTPVDDVLVKYLQQIRDHFGEPMVITSGYRCAAHNAAVGGAADSRHTKGQAADFCISGVEPVQIARYAERIGVLGIGLYDDFVHVDSRTRKSFWYGHGEQPRSTFAAGPEQTFTVQLRILGRGSNGADVTALQANLAGRGAKLTVDGQYGPATENAVKQFQQTHGLSNDGIAGSATQCAMLGIKPCTTG